MVEHGAWSVERAADLWELRARASEWERSQHEHDPTISTLELGTKEQGRKRETAKSNCAPLRATGHLLPPNTEPLFYFVLWQALPNCSLQ